MQTRPTFNFTIGFFFDSKNMALNRGAAAQMWHDIQMSGKHFSVKWAWKIAAFENAIFSSGKWMHDFVKWNRQVFELQICMLTDVN